ncbi:MAG: sulfotransferase domain-containing protein [Gammaproteobacteria bacterium]|nr:sulfotransferase domain-containing protein [Gammaproteobacteria bacterium]
MSALKGIFWLSSYPKSGNTWFRIFLANLLSLSKKNGAVNLNHVDYLINDHITTNRAWVNEMCGFDTLTLTDDELDALMPELYANYNEQQSDVTYHKTHRAYTYVNNHQPLMPLDQCLGAIHFIRNPLDVAISLANHFDFTIDDAINMMGDKSYALHYFPLRQLLLSWSMHVDTWVQSKATNLLLLRYEDMIAKPLETFTSAVNFLKLNANADLIKQALSYSSFTKLKKFEDEVGFLDKPPKLKHFFRKGIVNDWKTTLTENQILKIITDHSEIMRKFGYLNNNNEPIVG